MSSDRKVYLAAVLVMAFGLGNSQIRKHMDWLECLSGRINGRVADRALERENRLESLVEQVFVRRQNRIARDRSAQVRVQANLVCTQARIAQRQAAMVRSQIERVRVLDLYQAQRSMIIDRQNSIRNMLNRTAFPQVEMSIESGDGKI